MNIVFHSSAARPCRDDGWIRTRQAFGGDVPETRSGRGSAWPFRRGARPDDSRDTRPDGPPGPAGRFGALRALSEETVAPGGGIGLNPRDATEIITLPLQGVLRCGDCSGRTSMLRPGQIHVTATCGRTPVSIHNGSPDCRAEFLQIWLSCGTHLGPHSRQAAPDTDGRSRMCLLASPDGSPAGRTARIGQRAWLYRARLLCGDTFTHSLRHGDDGLYLFVVSGAVLSAGLLLSDRDGLGISGADVVSIAALRPADLLLFEVPMH